MCIATISVRENPLNLFTFHNFHVLFTHQYFSCIHFCSFNRVLFSIFHFFFIFFFFFFLVLMNAIDFVRLFTIWNIGQMSYITMCGGDCWCSWSIPTLNQQIRARNAKTTTATTTTSMQGVQPKQQTKHIFFSVSLLSSSSLSRYSYETLLIFLILMIW